MHWMLPLTKVHLSNTGRINWQKGHPYYRGIIVSTIINSTTTLLLHNVARFDKLTSYCFPTLCASVQGAYKYEFKSKKTLIY